MESWKWSHRPAFGKYWAFSMKNCNIGNMIAKLHDGAWEGLTSVIQPLTRAQIVMLYKVKRTAPTHIIIPYEAPSPLLPKWANGPTTSREPATLPITVQQYLLHKMAWWRPPWKENRCCKNTIQEKLWQEAETTTCHECWPRSLSRWPVPICLYIWSSSENSRHIVGRNMPKSDFLQEVLLVDLNMVTVDKDTIVNVVSIIRVNTWCWKK